MFDNLKIAITDAVQLKAVCDVLESMGCKKVGWIGYKNPKFITTNTKGFYTDHVVSLWGCFGNHPITTLTELLAMRDKQIKEKIGA